MDLPGEKLVIRMWETLSEKGIGGLLRPNQIRREGLAGISVDRAKVLIDAQTQRDAEEIKSGRKNTSDFSLELKFSKVAGINGVASRTEPTISMEAALEVCESRVLYDALRHETNTADAIYFAEEVLRGDSAEPSDDKIDEDWLYRWRDYTGSVSASDLQMLWGRVLAGEVKAPGTYSLRCLDFLRNLSQSEAKLIEVMCGLVVDAFIWRPETYKLPLSMGELLELEDLGLIGAVAGSLNAQISNVGVSGPGWIKILMSNDKCLVVKHASRDAVLHIPAFTITKLGREMSNLGSFKANAGYIEALGRFIFSQGYATSIADFVSEKDGLVTWKNEVVFT